MIHRRELWDINDLEEMTNITRNNLMKMRTRGLLPDPFKPLHLDTINETTVWRSREIRDWITAGMPPKSQWIWEPSIPPTYIDLIRIHKAEYHTAKELAEAAQKEAAELIEECAALTDKRDELARMVIDMAR